MYLLVVESSPQYQKVIMPQHVRGYEEQLFQRLQISQVTSGYQVSAAALGFPPGQTSPPDGVAASPIGQPVVWAPS